MLQAGPEDHGVWGCVLTSDPDHGRGMGRTWVDLGVVTRPRVSIGIKDTEVNVDPGHQPVPKMSLKQNHNYTFTCQVQRSFPRPEQRWKLNHTFSSLVYQNSVPVLIVSKNEYFYNTSFDARFKNFYAPFLLTLIILWFPGSWLVKISTLAS